MSKMWTRKIIRDSTESCKIGILLEITNELRKCNLPPAGVDRMLPRESGDELLAVSEKGRKKGWNACDFLQFLAVLIIVVVVVPQGS